MIFPLKSLSSPSSLSSWTTMIALKLFVILFLIRRIEYANSFYLPKMMFATSQNHREHDVVVACWSSSFLSLCPNNQNGNKKWTSSSMTSKKRTRKFLKAPSLSSSPSENDMSLSSQKEKDVEDGDGDKEEKPTTNITTSTSSSSLFLCNFCDQSFASRNALFRHLRSSSSVINGCKCCCEGDNNESSSLMKSKTTTTGKRKLFKKKMKKRKIGIRFGYYINMENKNNVVDTDDDGIENENNLIMNKNQNELAASLVNTSFFDALLWSDEQQQRNYDLDDDSRITISQTSVAKHRHLSLSQDYECSASSDFVCLNFQEDKENATDFNNENNNSTWPKLTMEMQKLINDRHRSLLLLPSQEEDNEDCRNPRNNMLIEDIQILDVQELPVKSKFHAEQSCTQRIYHYMLPLDWILSSDDDDDDKGQQQQRVKEWWNVQQEERRRQKHQPRGSHDSPPEVLIRLKHILKLFESQRLSKEEEEQQDDSKISSPGRFGSMWTRERRCWHNFADPKLGGKASPNNDPVWRVIDKARLAGIVIPSSDVDDDDEHDRPPNAIIEIRGDGFVTQQIRRIIGCVVAIANGWLPAEYIATATRSDICIETPLAPPGRSYLAAARFHFLELTQGREKNSLFSDEEEESAQQRWQKQLQSCMIDTICNSRFIQEQEHQWLIDLKDTDTPRIRGQIEKISKDDDARRLRQQYPQQQRSVSSSVTDVPSTTLDNGAKPSVKTEEGNHVCKDVPVPFQETLSLLREIVEQRDWPRTSRARSRVIRAAATVESTTAPDTIISSTLPKISSPGRRQGRSIPNFDGEMFQSGSFTVINSFIIANNNDEKLPLGNELFPDLVRSIFDLELQIIADDGMQRLPSTHCAVNRNAEFVPHVDSGKGQGQSLSMIVGLGDYENGGSLFVEGKSYNIRYQPFEFDGWRQRHWTEPFEGERYSLVWFTPAGMNVITTATNESGDSYCRKEDKRAVQLAKHHQAKLPDFPILKFRQDSTDALVINEILDTEKGCIYELSNHGGQEGDDGKLSNNANEIYFEFSPKGHRCVLDVGAHIGVFSRYALSFGCQQVIAYEPEPRNLGLLRYNLKSRLIDKDCVNNHNEAAPTQTILIYGDAVAHGSPGLRQLVHGRNRNDGTINTWRHSLEEYSTYVDNFTTQLSGSSQTGTLERSTVSTIPFFGGALISGVTFVKLDCEGAEIDILLDAEAGQADSWLDVSHLVFEWSFTKQKRISVFHMALHNLKNAGFNKIYYEGQSAWWDKEFELWPFHNDLVVFAVR